MEISIAEQLISCAAFAALGVFGSFLYSIVRLLLTVLIGTPDDDGFYTRSLPRLVEAIFDVLMGVFAAIAIATVAYAFSYGRNRVVNFLSFGVGFAAFAVTFGRILTSVAGVISTIIRRALSVTIGFLMRPPAALLSLIARLTVMLYSHTVGALASHVSICRNRRKIENIINNKFEAYVSFEDL